MFPTLKAIAKVVSKADVSACGLKPDQAHVVIIPDPKPGMYGLFLANDILMVDYGSAMSFRTKYCNLGFHKRVKVGRWPQAFAEPTLSRYFAENCDNPYAVIYVMGRLHRQDVTTPLTQLPPLAAEYPNAAARAEAVDRLLKHAQPTDLVFSRPRTPSDISTLIRSVDHCQFSHVAPYVGNGLTVDAGPDGIQKVSLADHASTTYLALYRLRDPLSEQAKSKMVKSWLESVGARYDWPGLLRVFLRKKFKLQVGAYIPSVSDILFSDIFQLVAHA
ncbi:MAG: hypothetical protein BWX68_02359 [Verrucomicrobia bacterium ADurb.Bin063]|nr:MAG: hypothetical protein BWX68_02359 [Verrucomicrobia bacterium ADurb.Bin063]